MALVAINDAHVELLRLLARLEETSEAELVEEAITSFVRARALADDGPLGLNPEDLDGPDLVGELWWRLREMDAAERVPAGVR